MIIKILLYPIVMIILSPIEYSVWRAYKQNGYNVPGYFKFLWIRTFGTLHQNDYKKLLLKQFP